MNRMSACYLLAALLCAGAAGAQAPAPLQLSEGDATLPDFHFRDGESLPEVRLHYRTLGTPVRNEEGQVTNAVLLLHGTSGSGVQFLKPQFADVLFAPGGLLDPARYYLILPDDLGHGKSSKPSDGLHARFPHYAYEDMVLAEYRLVTEGLKINHLRLILGTSMGCMHAFMWGENYPLFANALMPLACLPVQIAGRNRMWRKMIIDAITQDPDWRGGDYQRQPAAGLREAGDLFAIAVSDPLPMQLQFPTRDGADQELDRLRAEELAGVDANDLLYAVAASRDYDPSGRLTTIRAPLMWINSADDFINPPELGIAEQEIKKIPNGTFLLLPATEQMHGHRTHTWAALWQQNLQDLLSRSEHAPHL
ncbi:MAG: alpha/beta fold hydrolase [Steroidobacteraceae bacterium]